MAGALVTRAGCGGLRLHLVGLPVAVALTGATADERQVLLDILAVEPDLLVTRPGQLLLADKNYHGVEFEGRLDGLGSGCYAGAQG